ncbi:hypothetical protein [Streptomyces sp. TRM68367]|uniref:hypothetical protein n=1 Tax=Streptomyces sp. TRM68367 TaxID=2758415 RepID=UPI00165C29FA|nr:hypothetical protein [Streptomyces sp. TRM68367]MBC9731224.1 hypothetical protein [Streptomyces sp. TRM68367]
MDREEITHVSSAAVTVLRVTPLEEDGTPDHGWAMTYHYREPVLLGSGALERIPSFLNAPGENLREWLPPRRLAAIVAPLDHEQSRDVYALAQGLWQRRRTGSAVEAWQPQEPGTWWYTLIPWWRYNPDTDRWPLKELEGDHRAYAFGDVRPVNTYAWPALPPFPEAKALGPGTQVVIAFTETPPPPPGLPPSPEPPHDYPAAVPRRRPAPRGRPPV